MKFKCYKYYDFCIGGVETVFEFDNFEFKFFTKAPCDSCGAKEREEFFKQFEQKSKEKNRNLEIDLPALEEVVKYLKGIV